MEKSSRPCGIDYKPGAKCYIAALSFPLEQHCVSIVGKPIEFDFINVIDTESQRLLNESLIKVCAVPVCICNPIVRTRCYEELVQMVWVRSIGMAGVMVIEGETPL
jgi:hypothetical protein